MYQVLNGNDGLKDSAQFHFSCSCSKTAHNNHHWYQNQKAFISTRIYILKQDSPSAWPQEAYRPCPPPPKVSKMFVQFFVQNFVHFLSKFIWGGYPWGRPPQLGGTPGGTPCEQTNWKHYLPVILRMRAVKRTDNTENTMPSSQRCTCPCACKTSGLGTLMSVCPTKLASPHLNV